MNIIVVDDEELAVDSLVRVIRKTEPEAEVISFIHSEEALMYLTDHAADIIFLDIEMGDVSGLAFAKQCKEQCPSVNIIFVTGYSRYTMDAFRLHVSGYLMKPVRADDLRSELDNLRYPLGQTSKMRVRIQTFGNFEIFVDNRQLKFPRSKCKECLAYLVDRKGAGVTYAQLSSVLWENKPLSQNLQNITYKVISDLAKVLREHGVEDILMKSRISLAIDVSKVNCDYFSAVGGNLAWMNDFTGEYMTNYSWAEFTLGELIEIRQRNVQSKKFQ